MRELALVLSLTVGVASVGSFVEARELTFEQRVQAQAAIERIYHGHRVGTTRTFEQAVPRDVIEAKVRRVLQQSAALARAGRPVTATALQAELERIAERTRLPERLLEVYAALDHDSFLVQECFVRQHLVARLVSGLPLDATDSPALVEAVADSGVALPVPAGASVPCFPDDTWQRGPFDEVEARDGHTAVWTGTHMLIWGGRGAGTGLLATGRRYDPLADSWSAMSVVAAPNARRRHTAVWTGTLMLVWGGWDVSYLDTGGRYDPASDTWTPITRTLSAPAARENHRAIWADGEMIVWGGRNGPLLASGGRYDPASDTWSSTSLVGAPSARQVHKMVWTGDEMVVWGGNDGAVTNTGGVYDPSTDSWDPTSTSGAPEARIGPTAVWTGTRMVIWGGSDSDSQPLDTGGRYWPSHDSWQDTSTNQAPVARYGHRAVWTGDEMIVWGGTNNGDLDSGGRYDPQTNGWAPTSTDGAPLTRHSHTAVWTGDEMIVWGGISTSRLRSGGRYDPDSDGWAATAPAAPESRSDHSAVWTGTHMLVWGGSSTPLGHQNTGGRYDPLVDLWSPTSTTDAPSARSRHTAVWTGTHMLVWGGAGGEPLNELPQTGGRYNPLLDTWQPMTTVGAPEGRYFHTTVWTGAEMVVWGGFPEDTATGGRYDPAADSWQATSTAGAPVGRHFHAAVWTGNRMIVWGGYRNPVYQDTGGVYDPAADTWTPTSIRGAPEGRAGHTAVWTGSRMIVWGGNNLTFSGTGTRFDTGGLYDPDADTWAATSTLDVPTGRNTHTAIWTGSEMVVWGGQTGPPFRPFDIDTGGRYDPLADTWGATSTVDAPSARRHQTAVWSGSYMLIWGGLTGPSFGPYQFPYAWGRYALGHESDGDADGFTECDGDCNDASATIFPGAPELCDNLDNDCDGELSPQEVDGDVDGSPFCADCDDSDPATYPGAPELCDTLDNDCDLVEDEFVTTCGLGECVASGYCSAGVDSCVPGTPTAEVCDGLDNDCDGVVPTIEVDDDGDGLTECSGDCDDDREHTYPGAIEVNDGWDNQCSGDPGFGLTDEISGLATFVDSETFCWPAQQFAIEYEASRSNAPDQPLGCAQFITGGTCRSDEAIPAAGQAFFYLVRANCQWVGSLGADSEGVERVWGCESPGIPGCPD